MLFREALHDRREARSAGAVKVQERAALAGLCNPELAAGERGVALDEGI
jgi:hypothetical protein